MILQHSRKVIPLVAGHQAGMESIDHTQCIIARVILVMMMMHRSCMGPMYYGHHQEQWSSIPTAVCQNSHGRVRICPLLANVLNSTSSLQAMVQGGRWILNKVWGSAGSNFDY